MLLSKLVEFIKKNWLALLLVLALVAGFLWIQRQQVDYAKVIKDINDSHQVEIRKINEAREQEAKEHEAQLRQLQESIAKIESNYKLAQENLKKEQDARKGEIVRKYDNDAGGLANLLAGSFGFTVKQAQ